MRLSKAEMYALPIVLLVTAGLALAAFRIVGFLGVGILGLLIGFIAVQVDLEKGGAIGSPFASSRSAQHVMSRERMSASERAAGDAELRSVKRPLLLAKIIAAALIALGLGGFFFVE